MKKALVWIAGAVALASGCDSAPDAAPPDVISKDGAALVQVGRDAPSQMTGMGAVPVGISNGNNNFYLAIRKDALGQRWLLSGYVKQLQPFNGDFTLGTRVVTFSVQNDKMFLFDALDGQKQSSIINPAEVLEAYPIVHLPAFDQLPGASNYVLFDPATGLNKFAVNSQIYTEPFLTSITGGTTLPVKVGLSFMQNFRSISGGASYEQVIAGSFEGGGAPFSVWATLGLSLRRYFEGDGFVPFEVHPLTDNITDLRHFFLADNRIVPESGFDVVADQWHWNLHKGMKPIPVSVTAGIKRAQADFPDLDLMGAAKRGVESWNAVLGYRAFSVVFVDDDDVRDPDQNTVLVDYPGANLGYAFADWRGNPATGETLAGSVYMDGGFFSDLRREFGVDPLPDTSLRQKSPAEPAFPTWSAAGSDSS